VELDNGVKMGDASQTFTYKCTRRIIVEQKCAFTLVLPAYVSIASSESLGKDFLAVNEESLCWEITQKLPYDATPAGAVVDTFSLKLHEELPEEIPEGIKPSKGK
jgi:hypothetical protein